jgi:uncharacterized protein
MTTREARGLATADSEEESIAAYLQRHPEFFERHQALLARLRLPHVRGGSTISLVERQIEVLREKQAQLEGKLAELVRVARANDAIADRLHRFTRRLLRGASRDEALTRIEAGLREDFDAFHAALVLVDATLADPTTPRFVRTVSTDDPHLKSFESLFASGKPRCGQARDSQREFLFGPEGLELGSVALVPLGEKGALGLLALGSPDRDRFHPGMSTEFLTRLAELVADSLRTERSA